MKKKKDEATKKQLEMTTEIAKLDPKIQAAAGAANKEGTEILKRMRVEIQSKIEEEARNIKISEDNIAELKNLIDQNKTELLELEEELDIKNTEIKKEETRLKNLSKIRDELKTFGIPNSNASHYHYFDSLKDDFITNTMTREDFSNNYPTSIIAKNIELEDLGDSSEESQGICKNIIETKDATPNPKIFEIINNEIFSDKYYIYDNIFDKKINNDLVNDVGFSDNKFNIIEDNEKRKEIGYVIKKAIITYTNVDIETIEKFKMDRKIATKMRVNRRMTNLEDLEKLRNNAIDNTLKDNKDNLEEKIIERG